MIARHTSLPFAARPKKRRKPGRKPSASRSRVVHVRRPVHCHRHPLHVTVRLRQGLPSLRSQAMFERVLQKIPTPARFLRIVQWSVQSNRIHLLIEANDRGRLTQGMKGFAVRVAKGLNSLLGIRGRIWADRYHARALKTPREVRNVLVYVLCNRAKHGGRSGPDALSSGRFLGVGRRRPASERAWIAGRLARFAARDLASPRGFEWVLGPQDDRRPPHRPTQ